MRYITGSPQFDPRYTIDTHRTFQQIANRHRILITSLGTPITVFYAHGLNNYMNYSTYVPNPPCFCALDQNGKSKDPNRDHPLCYGTGVLPGYDRYGYTSHVIATTTPNTTLANVDKTIDAAGQLSKFVISSDSMIGTIESPNYPITDFKDFTYFKFAEKINLEENRNEYYFSTDNGSNYIRIPIDYTDKANPIVDYSVFPTAMTQLKFKIVQKKRLASSSPPVFVYIKFRYRSQYSLAEIDSRFKEVTIPATLTSYKTGAYKLEQQVYLQSSGLSVAQEPSWWILPEARIGNGDIIMFLLGHNAGQMHSVFAVEERVYGKFSYPTSISYQTKLIRDQNDAIGIVKYLAEDSEWKNYVPFGHFNENLYYPTEKELSASHYKNHQPGGMGYSW